MYHIYIITIYRTNQIPLKGWEEGRVEAPILQTNHMYSILLWTMKALPSPLKYPRSTAVPMFLLSHVDMFPTLKFFSEQFFKSYICITPGDKNT
jgi:hypothetical protein